MQEELLATIALASPHSRSETDESPAAGSPAAAVPNLLADLRADTSTQHRPGDIVRSVRRQGKKSRWLRAAAAVVLIGLLAVPIAWSYRDRLGPSVSGTLLPDRKIIAVLPFRVIGADQEEGLYSEGVSVVLTSNLAQLGVQDLQVMPSSEIREARIDTVEKARPNSVPRSCWRVWSSFLAARCGFPIP